MRIGEYEILFTTWLWLLKDKMVTQEYWHLGFIEVIKHKDKK